VAEARNPQNKISVHQITKGTVQALVWRNQSKFLLQGYKLCNAMQHRDLCCQMLQVNLKESLKVCIHSRQ